MQIVKEHGAHLVTYVNGVRACVYCVCLFVFVSGSFAAGG